MKLVDSDLDFWGYMAFAAMISVFVAAAFAAFVVLAEIMSGPVLLFLMALVFVFIILLVARNRLVRRERWLRR